MASTTKNYTLQHTDGTAVTAQEVYDAFASGIVLIDSNSFSGGICLAQKMIWADSSGGMSDPTDVVGCVIFGPFGEIGIGNVG